MKDLLVNIANHIKIECGVNVGVGQFPSSPDDIVIFNWKSGVKPHYALGKANAYRRRPFLMVEVRSKDFFTSLQQCDDIGKELERLNGLVGDKYVLSITATSDVLENGRDDKNRYTHLQNFIVDFRED